MEMRSYEAARSYFSFLAFLSWCVIILGLIVALGTISALGSMSRGFGGSAMAGLAGLVPGIGIAFLGFLGLVGVQIGRAGVDTAEYTQQGLKIAREQLDISRQALKQGSILEKGYTALQAAKGDLEGEMASASAAPVASFADAPPTSAADDEEISHQPGEMLEYRGKTIRVVEAGYVFSGTVFRTLGDAKARIDRDEPFSLEEPVAPKPYANQLGVKTGAKLGGATRS